ncbi:MAG: glutathione S-transferase C-terminal domain-containing protein, partial [Arenibacterium sp.]
SGAILRYLAAVFGDDAFWPRDARARADVDMWAEWGKNELCNAFTVPIFWSRVRTPAVDRDEARLATAVADFNDYMGYLGDQVSDRAFVCGDTLTAADIVIGHLLFRWFTIDVPRRPNVPVEAYYQRLTKRTAYREYVMVSYEDLRAEGA